MRSRIDVILVAACFLLGACKSIKQSSSALQHNWGETERSGHALNCQDEESFDPFFQAYIHKHIARIASENPTVFKSDLAADKFCVMPIDAPDVDAGASFDGTLVINTGLLNATDSDAQFAAAIAHELAHVTLNHGQLTFAAFVALHPQYQLQADQLAAAAAALGGDKVALTSLDYRRRTLLSNWTETEADEVGFEFYLRAGYDPLQFSQLFRNLDGQRTASDEACIRGEANHPRDCWRAQNSLNELAIHQADYRHVAPDDVVVNLFGDDLAKLIQKYRTMTSMPAAILTP